MSVKYISVPLVCEILYSPAPESHLRAIITGMADGTTYHFVDGTPITATTNAGIIAETATWHKRNRTNPVRDYFQAQMAYASETYKRKLIADLREYLAELEQ